MGGRTAGEWRVGGSGRIDTGKAARAFFLSFSKGFFFLYEGRVYRGGG